MAKTNFLTETVAAIKNANQSSANITFIGFRDGDHCLWLDFLELANFEYDNDYGCYEIAIDLVILFNNGGEMCRREYDGSEWWEYREPLKIVLGDLIVSSDRFKA